MSCHFWLAQVFHNLVGKVGAHEDGDGQPHLCGDQLGDQLDPTTWAKEIPNMKKFMSPPLLVFNVRYSQ